MDDDGAKSCGEKSKQSRGKDAPAGSSGGSRGYGANKPSYSGVLSCCFKLLVGWNIKH